MLADDVVGDVAVVTGRTPGPGHPERAVGVDALGERREPECQLPGGVKKATITSADAGART